MARIKRSTAILLFVALTVVGQLQVGAQAQLVKAVNSVGVTVSDMDRAVAFYSDALSFAKVSDIELEGPAYEQLLGVFGLRIRVVRMQLGDEFLVLTQYIAPPGGKPIPADSRSNDLWFQHFAVVVSNMEQAYEHVSKHRVRQISPSPQVFPTSNTAAAGIKAFKFRDPDGHNLELLWFPPDKGDARWHRPSEDLFLGIDHTAIAVSDTDASLKFYRDLLGMEVKGESLNVGTEQEHLDNVFGARVHVTGIRSPVQTPGIEFLQYETPRGGRPMPEDVKANDIVHWQTALVVDDVEAAAKRLQENNIRFVSNTVRTLPDDALGFEKAVMIRDPDGHAMLLIERTSTADRSP